MESTLLKFCVKLATDIYDFKQKMESDDEACRNFFNRVNSLSLPLARLNSQQINLGSKKASLDEINNCLSKAFSILNSWESPDGIKRLRMTFIDNLKENLLELNVQLDRCISALNLCLSVDGDIKLDNIAEAQQVSNDSILNKLDEIASALQAQSLNSCFETQFQRDPYPEDFEDERSILGRGAFGVTHRMKNIIDKGVYAVKVIRVCDAEKAGMKTVMMIREATTLRDLNHKYLVRYYTSYFSKEGKLFNLVMELVSGGSLDNKIKDQSVTVAMIRQWLVQLADVLSYLHSDKHTLHRDIKPDNILLTASGSIKLIDLGMACVYESALSKMSKVGAQTYCSYEKAHGLPYDGRDDVWGAGCVFGELLTKSRLTERGGSLYEHSNAEVTRRRLSLIGDCMAINNEIGTLLSQMLEPDVSIRITSHVLWTELSRSYSSFVTAVGRSRLPSGSEDNLIKVWDTSNHNFMAALTGHTDYVCSLTCDLSRNRLFSGSWDKSIKVWDMSSHARVTTLTGHSGTVWSLACDVSRDRLYSGSADKSIKVWNLSSHSCMASLMGHSKCVRSLVYDANGDKLYSGSWDKSIMVWDMTNFECLAILNGHTNCVCSLVLDVTRRKLYSGSDDKSIMVWDLTTYECLTTLSGHTNYVCSLVFDDSRGILYSGSWDTSIKVWDMTTYECVATLSGHSNYVCSLVCDVVKGRLYSGSWDKLIKVWDMATLKCVATLTGHSDYVCSLMCDSSRGRLYSGSGDDYFSKVAEL